MFLNLQICEFSTDNFISSLIPLWSENMLQYYFTLKFVETFVVVQHLISFALIVHVYLKSSTSPGICLFIPGTFLWLVYLSGDFLQFLFWNIKLWSITCIVGKKNIIQKVTTKQPHNPSSMSRNRILSAREKPTCVCLSDHSSIYPPGGNHYPMTYSLLFFINVLPYYLCVHF